MKLTFLWQGSDLFERDWIAEIFAPVTGEKVFDGRHSVVLDNCLLLDSYIHAHPSEYYRQFRGKNAWLFHLSDETYEGGYDRYENFRGVIRNYWSGIFNPHRVLQIPLGYAEGIGSQDRLLTSAERKYLWCFAGAGNKSSRPEMLRTFEPLKPAFVHISDRGNLAPIGKEQYVSVLRDSVFVPSSMGNVNLDCFRVYEALQCGSIPLLERRFRFDYFRELLGPHPLPTFSNWDQAARYVASMQSDSVAMDRLLLECSQWWSAYKRALGASIEEFIAHPKGTESGDFVTWRHSLPGSQALELLRHHNLPALVRRIGTQIGRMTSEGRLRKTAGT
jgi:hypothetical protein